MSKALHEDSRWTDFTCQVTKAVQARKQMTMAVVAAEDMMNKASIVLRVIDCVVRDIKAV